MKAIKVRQGIQYCYMCGSFSDEGDHDKSAMMLILDENDEEYGYMHLDCHEEFLALGKGS